MNKKAKVIVISIAVVIALLLTAAVVFLNYGLEDYVRAKLDKNITSPLDIEFEHIDFSLFSMTSDVIGLDISRRDSTGLFWNITADSIEVAGIHPLQILFAKELIANEVRIKRPEAIIHKIGTGKSKPTKKPKNDFVVIVKKAVIENGVLTYQNDSVGSIESLFQIETGELTFGKHSIKPLQLSEAIDLNLKNVSFSNKDSTELLTIKEVTKNLNSRLTIDSLSWIPQLDLNDFSKYHGWRKSQTTLNVNRIAIQMPTLNSDSTYRIEKINISGADVDLEKDLSYGLPERETSLPQAILEKMDVKFSIDSILIDDSRLAIKLHREEGLIAQLNLQNIQGSAYVTNRKKEKNAFGFSSTASTLNGSSLQVRTDYFYGRNNPWTLSGSLADTELKFFSDFLRKMAGVEIASGKLNKLKFQMEGNNQINEGTVTFLYDELNLRAVHKETGKKKVVLNALTDILGSLVLWKKNPANGHIRYGEFSVERDPRRAFPSQWIQGLVAGLLETVSKVDPMKIRRNEGKKKNE